MFCNSGERFKSCCGSKDPNRQPSYGVNVIHNYISAEQCDDWTRRAETKKREALKIVDVKASTRQTIENKLDPSRVTEYVVLGDLEGEMNKQISLVLRNKVEPLFKRRIAWLESAI